MSENSARLGEVLLRLGLVTQAQLTQALELQARTGQRIGEALVSLGAVTRPQLEEGLLEALGLRQTTQRAQLGELLIGLKHLTPLQLDEGLARQRRDGRKLGAVLVELGHCSYKQIYEALALQQRMAGRPGQVAAPPASARPRVLVVDDSPLACNVVKEGLVALGYEVDCFQDPFEALEGVARVRPNIVLTDLEMPGMDGHELCRRLKEGPSRAVPVIMLTANDGDAQRVRGLRAGADDYVNKSASLDELAARIESVVRRTGETEKLRKLFARYTSDAVVEEVLRCEEGIILTGEKREVTVLFADLRNFTGLAESLPAEHVVEVLNEVLGRLADAVLTCGGTLDKFLGDGLMAVFGAPVRREDDPIRAIQAAQMMMEAVRALNARSQEDGRLPQLQLGVGVNTGPAVVGNVGSSARTEYTCIGDTVNVASRLCALAGAGEILVGERTRERVQDGGLFEDLPPVRVKGRAQPVPLYRLATAPAA